MSAKVTYYDMLLLIRVRCSLYLQEYIWTFTSKYSKIRSSLFLQKKKNNNNKSCGRPLRNQSHNTLLSETFTRINSLALLVTHLNVLVFFFFTCILAVKYDVAYSQAFLNRTDSAKTF